MIGRKKNRRSRMVRILFATDLHGADLVFRKFLNAGSVYEADIAVLGGPDREAHRAGCRDRRRGPGRPTGSRRCHRPRERQRRLGRDRGPKPRSISGAGDDGEYHRLEGDAAEREKLFERECLEQVQRWLALGRERLEPHQIPLYVTGGNDDYEFIEPALTEDPYAINANGQVVVVGPGLEMISTGLGNITPWNCPRDVTEDELSRVIEGMAAHVTEPTRAIFNFHVPPFGSGLDSCPRLDTSVSPPRPMAGELMAAGSTAVRAAIEKYGPLLSLHGHIHESASVTKRRPYHVRESWKRIPGRSTSQRVGGRGR